MQYTYVRYNMCIVYFLILKKYGIGAVHQPEMFGNLGLATKVAR